MSSDDLPKMEVNHETSNKSWNISWEIPHNIDEERKTIAWILDNSVYLYSKDTDDMLEKLVILEETLSSTLRFYHEEYDKEFENIKALWFCIGFTQPTEGFSVDNVAIKAIFSGLHNMNLSHDELVIFQGFYESFMQQNQKIQAAMLWFFELIDAYVTPENRKANQEFLEKNPCIRLLFKNSAANYIEWIAQICKDFDADSWGMIVLSHAIPKGAEASEIDMQRAEMIWAEMLGKK